MSTVLRWIDLLSIDGMVWITGAIVYPGHTNGVRVQEHITEMPTAEKAVVHYSIPLPEDSPLAGMRQQEIDLPEEVLA